SDGSLCLMEAITRSHSQGMVSSTTPKLENFFGGVTMGTSDNNNSTMYYNQNLDLDLDNHYQDYSGLRPLYQAVQQEQVNDDINSMKNWISTTYSSGVDAGGDLQSLSLSMGFGCEQAAASCVSGASQQQIMQPVANVTECVVVDNKKRSCEKVDQQKPVVHRKSLDTFGQRTSQYRGVT
ncbi:hypothetical protein M8C21_029553, partial [Ambrosia artemisiifolia]